MPKVPALMVGAALALAGCAPSAVEPRPAPDAGIAVSELIDRYADRQKYWDLADAPRAATPVGPNPSAEACEAHLGEMLALREPGTGGSLYAEPELMALGDSLYNGVESMRISWWLAEWSAPAMVAIRMELIEEKRADRTGRRRFYVPQYPSQGDYRRVTQDYGLNFENIPRLRGLLGLPRQQGRALEELAFRYVPRNGRAMVENIAFSGANSHDLLNWSADEHAERARYYIDRTQTGSLVQRFGALGSAFFHANAAFVLNPMRDPCIGRLTPVEQFMKRQPRRLLVNIGPNDGMFRLAFSDPDTSRNACDKDEMVARGVQNGSLRCAGLGVSIRTSMTEIYPANIKELLGRFSGVKHLEEILINGLPLPSQTANLVPEWSGGQVRWYSDVTSSPSNRTYFTSTQVDLADDLVRDVNRQIREIVASANTRRRDQRVVWVDTPAELARYDAKRCLLGDAATLDACRGGRQLVLKRHPDGVYAVFDNQLVDLGGETGVFTGIGANSKVRGGGLFSFDNMHLSTVDYEVLAGKVFEAMGSVPEAPRHACLKPGDPGYENLRYGDCAALLVMPGWSYADATRRQFQFLRWGGLQQTQDRARLSARIAFLNRLM